MPTCSAFSRAARTSSVNSPTCLLAFLNCLAALPTCLARPSTPPPVPGTGIPRTFFGVFARVARMAPPTSPAAPVTTPATTGSFELPPFWLRALPPPPDEEERLRDDAEEERRLEALVLPLPLFAFVLERGLLFDAVPLFARLPLFDALERVLRELALDPFAL